jgi:hypothetical protein
MCCGDSAEMMEEMMEWQREKERQERLAKANKVAQSPVILVKAKN